MPKNTGPTIKRFFENRRYREALYWPESGVYLVGELRRLPEGTHEFWHGDRSWYIDDLPEVWSGKEVECTATFRTDRQED